jgi:hypothetical protein
MLQKMKYWIYYTMIIKFFLKEIVAKINGWNWSALNHIQNYATKLINCTTNEMTCLCA